MTFEELAEQVAAQGPVTLTPRRLVEMVGAKRRGSNIVTRVQSRLARYGLTTERDLFAVGADAPIRVVKPEDTQRTKPSYLKPLTDAVAQLETSPEAPTTVSVREMLSWFGAHKRGALIAEQVAATLAGFELRTRPDFNSVHIDTEVELVPLAPRHATQGTSNTAHSSSADDDLNDTGSSADSAAGETTWNVGTLDEAKRDIISVKPQSSLREAMSLMLSERLSHLPIMASDHQARRVLRWKDLGRQLVLNGQISLDDSVDAIASEAVEVRHNQPFLDVIPKIIEHSCVLVRGHDGKFSGIITKKDLGKHLLARAKPFVTLGEIERGLRVLIERGEFTTSELQNYAIDPKSEKTVSEVSELTLGQCQRLLERPEAWERLELSIEKNIFVKALDRVRATRNRVMHFDPAGQDDVELSGLSKFLQLIYDLRKSTDC